MKTQIEISRELIPEDCPDLSYLEQDYSDCSESDAENYRLQDATRLSEYGDNWEMLGVRAKAKIQIPHGNDGTRILCELHSPGLWFLVAAGRAL